MGYNLKNARNGKSILKIPKWPSLRPSSIKNEILRRSEFLKNKKICMKKVVGEQGLALQQQFPYKSSKFSENSNCHINLQFNARDLKLGHSSIFNMLFPFLVFFKL